MKKILILITAVIALTALRSSAQPINRSTSESLLKSAQEAEASNNPYAALEFYDQVYDETKDKSILVKLAKLDYDLRDYAAAEKRYSRLVLRDRRAEYTELKFWYAMSLKYGGKYPEAIDVFKQYLAEGADQKLKDAAKREIEGCEMGRKAKQPDNLLINNAGKKVNSPQTEASPSYSGGELYFTSLAAKDIITLNGKEGDWYAKVFTSSRAGVEFGDAQPLGVQINREGWHQGNVSVTPDGKTMYFTRVQTENNGVTESKIYYANKGADGWGAANEVTGVNGEYVAKHPCEGELFGEKVLFFVANLPGGEGGFDIYYATKKTEGVFSLPVNLGKIINTAGDELSPFYRDGKLYFSSDGRVSLGGLDVFESQWNGAVWSEPRNLGLGINSSVDDQFYSRSQDGMSGFFVSNRPGPNNLKSKTCCDDIYAWEIERVKVDLLARTFRYKKKSEKENPPLTACTVQVYDVTDKNPANVENKTNDASNEFGFTLQPDKSYLIIATHEGYVPDTVKFNTVGVKKSTTVEKKLTLRSIRPPKPEEIIDTIRINEPIRLNNIYYDFDDDKILPDAEKDLQYLVDLMNKYPDMKIELSSHTDARGNDEYNERLSQRRANSAKRWMVTKGITTDRITPVGYGEKQILNQCLNGVECTDEEHRFNRRTEFKILSGPTVITTERIEKRPATNGKTGGDKPKGQKSGGNK